MENIICMQPFACLPNHVTGKGMMKALRKRNPMANIAAIDYDPGASDVNQLNRIKLMMATAHKNLEKKEAEARAAAGENAGAGSADGAGRNTSQPDIVSIGDADDAQAAGCDGAAATGAKAQDQSMSSIDSEEHAS